MNNLGVRFGQPNRLFGTSERECIMTGITAAPAVDIQEEVDELLATISAPAWLEDFQFVLSDNPRNIRSVEILDRLDRHGLRHLASLKFESSRGMPVPRVQYAGGEWRNGDKIYPLMNLLDHLAGQQVE